MRKPTKAEVDAAKAEIAREDEAARNRLSEPDVAAQIAENQCHSQLPSEHPDHIHGIMCDGQDGMSSYCSRLRFKLFGKY